MKPRNLRLLIISFYICGILLYIFGYILTHHGAKQDNIYFLIPGAVLLAMTPFLSSLASKKAILLRTFLETVNKLDGSSLNLLHIFNNRYGLMTAKPEWIDNPTVRYLLQLDVLGVEVFPNGNHGYYLTNLGRYLLREKLGAKLYPEIFCEWYKIRFWLGFSDFNQKKKDFEKKYVISWERSAEILKNILMENEVKANDDIKEMFDIFCQKRDFNSIKNNVVMPWRHQINKEMFKSFKLYFIFRIVPFWQII